MLVIFEGPDASGKTTLLEQLNVDAVVKCGPPKTSNPFEEYRAMIHRIDGYTAFDRFFHGECVWGPMFRGGGLEPWKLLCLEMEAAVHGVLVVWCDASTDVIVKRIYGRKNPTAFDLLSTDRLGEVKALYKKVREQSRINRYYEYDSGMMDYRDAAKVIKDLLHVPAPSWRATGVGNWFANVALVGDHYAGHENLPPPGSYLWKQPPWKHCRPFCNERSGRYLWERLLDIKDFRVEDVYVTNSRKDWLERSDETLFEELRSFKRVVALGKQAEKRLKDIKVDCERIPHPQFWKRFNYNLPWHYVRMLREAIYAS